MSSTLRHVSHGGAGDTGAPRPTLVKAAGASALRAHEISAMSIVVMISARPVFEASIGSMRAMIGRIAGPHQRAQEQCERPTIRPAPSAGGHQPVWQPDPRM